MPTIQELFMPYGYVQQPGTCEIPSDDIPADPISNVHHNLTNQTTANWPHAILLLLQSAPVVILVTITIHNAKLIHQDQGQKVPSTGHKGAWASFKILAPIVSSLISLMQFAFNENDTTTTSSLLTNLVPCYGWIKLFEAGVFGGIAVLTIMMDHVSRYRWRLSSLISFCSFMLVTTGSILFIQSTSSIFSNPFEFGCLLDLTKFHIVALSSLLCWVSDRLRHLRLLLGAPEAKFVHPEDNISWWSNLTLSWSTSMVWIGFKHNLEESDVPWLHQKDKCSNVYPPLEHAWKQDEFRCKPNKFFDKTYHETSAKLNESEKEHVPVSSSLFRALIKAYGLKFITFQIIKVIVEMDELITPMLTAALMDHVQKRGKESIWRGVRIVAFIFLFKCVLETLHSRISFAIDRLSKNMQTGVILLVFKKSLVIQNKSTKGMSKGEIVKLISGDCDNVFLFGKQLYLFLMAPLKACIALYFLYIYLGRSMLAGVTIMLAFIPLNSYVGRRMNRSNKFRFDIRDKRFKLMNEIINGIKMLKLYAWEQSFMDKVNALRSQEIKFCKKKTIYVALMFSIFRAVPILVQVSAFGTYLILGGHLDPTKGFVVVQLFNTLNSPLSVVVLLIPSFVEALVSLKRITKFLNGEDLCPGVINKTHNARYAIQVKDGAFTWIESSSGPTLTSINMKIPKGKLVAVVGMVGCGKSSLLSAILGEMKKLDGTIEVEGSVAYVPQEAWILNASLQDNVLFGSRMNTDWYREVVHGCNLRSDIRMMEAEDQTKIGEKGVNLSGGQKQRVSLARAVYNDADVYLLDDPLSAVDIHVGKHIFRKVLSHRGLLKDKTRLLVTHGIHWLPFVDSVIVMKNGQVSEVGTYEQLLSRDGDFAQVLNNLSSHSSVTEDEGVRVLKHNIFQRLSSVDCERKVELEAVKGELENFAFSESDSKQEENDKKIESRDESEAKKSFANLTEDEELEQGAVKRDVYFEYLKAIGFRSASLCVFTYCVSCMAANLKMYTMKLWTDDPLLANTSMSQTNEYWNRSRYHFYSFSMAGMMQITSAFLFYMFTRQRALDAANGIHRNLLNNVLRCPMSFFETTPSFRIIQRFSSDISKVDGLSGCLQTFIERSFVVCSSLLLIVMNVPFTLVCLVPASLLYYLLHRIHISTLRQLRRYSSKYYSPMCVHFSETLNGVSSIRAYHYQSRFIRTMERKVDDWLKFDTMEMAINIWIRARLSILHFFIQAVSGLVVVIDTTMTGGMAGLVLMHAGNFADSVESLVRLSSYLETEIVSLERVLEYTKKSTEAPWQIAESKPSADWPEDGHVVLNDYTARYRDDLNLVLQGVSCEIRSGERIGIVGRTGAGKSSLMMALFRLIEASRGHIEIDGKQISDLGLHDLRSKITILPQDPFIFAGTLRMNLDPLEKFTTEELWGALRHSHLKSYVEGLPDQLAFQCEEGGRNLSVGQRQLLCLARTFLRQTRILVLDEATAAVDVETDGLIQKTIRSEFGDCTVLSIAHRLNTIIDYDRILVLDQGTVKEFDSPEKLLANENSLFHKLAKEARLIE